MAERMGEKSFAEEQKFFKIRRNVDKIKFWKTVDENKLCIWHAFQSCSTTVDFATYCLEIYLTYLACKVHL